MFFFFFFDRNNKWLFSASAQYRHHHRSTSKCRQDRPHRIHHIHRRRQHTAIQFLFNTIMHRCHHKDQSRSFRIARRHNCRHRRNKTRRCSHPPSRWIRRAIKFEHNSSRQVDDGHAVRTRNAEKFTVWIIAIRGAHSANGRRHAVDLVNENYLKFKQHLINTEKCCPKLRSHTNDDERNIIYILHTYMRWWW